MTSPFKNNILSGRVVVITGGGSGIGLEIACEFGEHGCCVVVVGRRENVLRSAVNMLTKKGVRALACPGDVRSYESCRSIVAKVVEEFKSIDILVNGAAGNFLCAAENLSPAGFKTVMDIDTVGTFNMSSACFPALKQSKFGGNIVNISATLHYSATWYQLHASAAKAANDAITRSLALEWGEFGIRVNAVAPGPISDTPGFSKLGGGHAEELIAQFVPLRRAGTKREIAHSILFLCCDAAKYITGAIVVVDGGHWLYNPQLLPRDTVKSFAKKIERKSRAVGLAKL